MKRGLFITLEGGEGAGKSTCLPFIKDRLQQAGHDVVVTREPGGTAVGEKIREILLHAHALHIVPDSELLLVFAARAQHIKTVIEPALAAGKTVLCDRFTDASYAYQGGGRGIPAPRIALLETWVQAELRPDLTLLFDLPVEKGLQRAGARSAPDRFEREGRDFLKRIREHYLSIARREPQRVKVINASQELAHVEAQLTTILKGLPARGRG